MMRSLWSGVSGLVNHQVRMDVLGNNIANVNTYGFKKERVTFQDILSQTISGAARPTEERGGINPKQVGLGMTIASIDKIMTQGSIQTTGRNTDLAIAGDGFFILKKGEQVFYTRAGNFYIDRDGRLVDANGLRVQGWLAQVLPNGERIINTSSELQDLIIPKGDKFPAKATSIVKFRSNLDSRTPIIPPGATEEERIRNTHTASIDIYDNYGNTHRLSIGFVKEGINTWRATATVDGAVPDSVVVYIGQPKPDVNNQFLVQFNTDGRIASVTEGAGANPTTINQGDLIVTVSYQLPDGTTHTVNLMLGRAGEVTNSLTQFASPSTASAYDQDGYPMGYLESFSIDSAGVITAVYTNGQRAPIGQIALATFTNPEGLEKAGENLFVESNNSGMPQISPAETQGKGKIYAGALEMSNVDLSEAFTDMIVTQRGFQANSRTITTTDQMLQEILTLKR